MTSFKAMTDTTKGITKVMSINSNDRYLSYLPIAHGMERWLGMVRLQLGLSSYDNLLHFRFFSPQTNFFVVFLFYSMRSVFHFTRVCKFGMPRLLPPLLLTSTVASPLYFCRYLGK